MLTSLNEFRDQESRICNIVKYEFWDDYMGSLIIKPYIFIWTCLKWRCDSGYSYFLSVYGWILLFEQWDSTIDLNQKVCQIKNAIRFWKKIIQVETMALQNPFRSFSPLIQLVELITQWLKCFVRINSWINTLDSVNSLLFFSS